VKSQQCRRLKAGSKGDEAMRNERVTRFDADDVFSPHYLPAELSEKFVAAEQRRRRHFWIWTLIVSMMLSMMGMAIWLANRM
jgi:hypothetical protein